MSAVAGVFAKETGYGFAFTSRGIPWPRSRPPRRRRNRTSTRRSSATCAGRRRREGPRQGESAAVAPADHQVASGAAVRALPEVRASSPDAAPAVARRRRFDATERRCSLDVSPRSCGVRLDQASDAFADDVPAAGLRCIEMLFAMRVDRTLCRPRIVAIVAASSRCQSRRVSADFRLCGVGASKIKACAGIAQLVEQRFCKPLVVGSIPTAGTR